MKKLCTLILAAVFCFSAFITAGAINYAENPGYELDTAATKTPVSNSALNNALNNGTTLNIDSAALFTTSHFQIIANSGKDLTLRSNTMGYNLTIHGNTINIKTVEDRGGANMLFNLETTKTTIKGVSIPKDGFAIIPSMKGAFGFTVTMQIDENKLTKLKDNYVQFNHVDGNGKITALAGIGAFYKSGSLSVSFSNASWYMGFPVDLTGNDGAQGGQGAQGIQGNPGPQGPQGPQGRPGRDGVDGADGTDGRDGSVIYIDSGGSSNTGGAGGSGNTGNTGGGSGGGNNWWNYEKDGNPPTNAVVGVTGLSVIAVTGVILYLFKKRRLASEIDEDDEDYEE